MNPIDNLRLSIQSRMEINQSMAPAPESSATAPRAVRSPSVWLLIAILAAGAWLRVWFALTDDGIDWPDEIYQSLEPAHRLVFGYGILPWEYVEGARTWLLPGIRAGIFKLAGVIGLTDPAGYLRTVRLVFVAIGVATAWGSYRLARVHGADPLPAAFGAAFFSLAAPAVYFAPRAMSETI